ncbi:uncharacterized protein V1518DRAFT_428278 [Limtongia smithiae]|uniref:uncharacterized protein n=1 Tax=Limtongia smithiae TaxID=1125753 RepID=UPI0034CEA310
MDENAILTAFLTDPALLSDTVTRRQFVALFPKDKRAEPADVAILNALYRDLYVQRGRQVRAIERKIGVECALTARAVRTDIAFARQRMKEDGEDARQDDEASLYADLIPDKPKNITLRQMLERMANAVASMEQELAELDATSRNQLQQVNIVIDSLSDLHYRKLSQSTADECVTALRDLEHQLQAAGEVSE